MKSFLRVFDFRFDRASLLRPSVLSLITANLFPVFGVIFLRWDAFPLLVLFWMENLVIGVYTVLKMAFASGEKTKATGKAFYIPFFCVHYGIFTVVHGVFVFTVFGGFFESTSLSAWQVLVNYQLGWGALALLTSHGVSFFYNYIRGGEYKQSNLNDLMQQPYGRVVILHLTIIFGGFLVMALGSPIVGLILLIGIKTAIDIRTHLRQHDKYRARKPAAV